ncbi:hypothetical protein [Marinobacter subterrani]|uniref:hypothetical protein n=1 Tax=Marinobacter subterrani TaxID=1658765 RepID=UPI0023535E6C|nr:hypothetical protein [Marinobacter subterrani]
MKLSTMMRISGTIFLIAATPAIATEKPGSPAEKADTSGFPMPDIIEPVVASKKSACGVPNGVYGTLQPEELSGLQIAGAQAHSGNPSKGDTNND